MNCPVLTLASAISGGIFFLDEVELGPCCLVTRFFLIKVSTAKFPFSLAPEQRREKILLNDSWSSVNVQSHGVFTN